MKRQLLPFLVSILGFSTGVSSAAFSIVYNFADISPENQAVFNNAKAFWEGVITGRMDGSNHVLNINVSTFSEDFQNGTVTLGSAGPSLISNFSFGGESYTVSTEGDAEFNTHPNVVSGGLLNEMVIRHEIGHIIGIGTLWGYGNNSDVYASDSGQFTGSNAVAAYNAEFGKNQAFVPVELDGGQGTAGGHWNESVDNPREENVAGSDSDPGDSEAGPLAVSGPGLGKSLDDELMTGFMSGDAWLSNTTIASLQDIGYSVIPEPSGVILSGIAGIILTFRRRRGLAQ